MSDFFARYYRDGDKNYYWSERGGRYTHKYVFYFFPKIDPETGKELDKGVFRFFGRVKHGKEYAERTGRRYVHDKLF